MKRRASATMIGAFVVGGLALLAALLVAVAGNDLFTRKDRAVMHFTGSLYGLQVGAPVVFRGVRIGSVTSIAVNYDADSDSFVIPVVAELERDAVRGLDGKRTRDDSLRLPALVQRGLRAQLSMQSLLTGLLYVDLDLHPEKEGTVRGNYAGTAVEIPTTTTAIQNLKDKLDGIDFKRITEDLSAIAGSAKDLVASPQIKQAIQDVATIVGNVKQLTERVSRRIDPLADGTQRTLERLGSAADGVKSTADGFKGTAQKVDVAADQLAALLKPDAPLVQNLQRSADEIGRTAAALRQTTSADSPLLRNTERVLGDLSRAARALRDLAEALEQHPESLLRGKPAEAAQPAAVRAPNATAPQTTAPQTTAPQAAPRTTP